MLPRIVCELINVIGSALCSSLGFHVDKAFWLSFLVGETVHDDFEWSVNVVQWNERA